LKCLRLNRWTIAGLVACAATVGACLIAARQIGRSASVSGRDPVAAARNRAAWERFGSLGSASAYGPDGDPVTAITLKRHILTPDDWDVLAGCEQLETLTLIGCGVTDADLVRLAAHPRLSRLDLSDNPISAAGLARLGDLRALDRLTVQKTRLTGAAAWQPDAFPSLRWIDMEESVVGPDTLKGLGQTNLRQGLARLDVARLTIDPPNRVELPTFAGLEFADLRQIELAHLGNGPLAGASGLQMLDVCGTKARGFGFLRAHPRLSWLMACNTGLGDADLAELPCPEILEVVDLSGSKLSDGAAVFLAKCRALRHLHMSDTAITDRTLGAVALLPALDTISVTRTGCTPEGAARCESARVGRSVVMTVQGTGVRN